MRGTNSLPFFGSCRLFVYWPFLFVSPMMVLTINLLLEFCWGLVFLKLHTSPFMVLGLLLNFHNSMAVVLITRLIFGLDEEDIFLV
jgi:hypothetical protein